MKEKRMINLKLQHPPPGDPLAFECYLCLGGGGGGKGKWTLLEWVGNFNLNCQVFFGWINMIYPLIWGVKMWKVHFGEQMV